MSEVNGDKGEVYFLEDSIYLVNGEVAAGNDALRDGLFILLWFFLADSFYRVLYFAY